MTNTKFELKVDHQEMPFKNVNVASVGEGWAINQGGDHDPETIAVFDNKEYALKALDGFTSKVDFFDTLGGVQYMDMFEYYVQEVEYNEDEEVEDLGDIWTASCDRSVLDY